MFNSELEIQKRISSSSFGSHLRLSKLGFRLFKWSKLCFRLAKICIYVAKPSLNSWSPSVSTSSSSSSSCHNNNNNNNQIVVVSKCDVWKLHRSVTRAGSFREERYLWSCCSTAVARAATTTTTRLIKCRREFSFLFSSRGCVCVYAKRGKPQQRLVVGWGGESTARWATICCLGLCFKERTSASMSHEPLVMSRV